MVQRDFRIETASGREKLAARREPYWHRIESGCFVGFRKLSQGEGTWIARWRTPENKQVYHSLEHQPNLDTAVRAARSWFAQCEGGSHEVISVAEACKRYVDDRRLAKGSDTANDADGRFKRLVNGTQFGKIELDRLKTADITKWFHGLVKNIDDFEDEDEQADEFIRRSKDSANRNLRTLKAALNFAYRQGMASSRGAWERVAAFHGVGARRTRFLTLEERQALVNAAAPDLATLIAAIAYTGARPGELANAKVRDFHGNGVLELDGKTGHRHVPLSPKATKHFATCAGQRDGKEPLLMKLDGKQWDRYSWRDSMQLARTNAGLPCDVVLYNIRHAAISEMIIGGIDILTAARLTGTSLEMIQKHYGHLKQAQAIALLSKIKMI